MINITNIKIAKLSMVLCGVLMAKYMADAKKEGASTNNILSIHPRLGFEFVRLLNSNPLPACIIKIGALAM